MVSANEWVWSKAMPASARVRRARNKAYYTKKKHLIKNRKRVKYQEQKGVLSKQEECNESCSIKTLTQGRIIV